VNRRLLRRGSRDHYLDAALYDHEYRRRREDVRFYRKVADEAGGPILELGCGTGRVTMPLARDGHHLVGFDISSTMLARARQRLTRLPKRCPRPLLFRGDLQHFALGRRFPLIISAFNTLQHVYTAERLLAVLAHVARHLETGGLFAFDVLMPDCEWLARDPEKRWVRRRFRHPETGEQLIYSTNHDYDAVGQVAYVRIYYSPVEGEGNKGQGNERVVHLAHRQWYPQELSLILETAGFRVEARYGGFGREGLSSVSESQIYLCRLV